MSPIITPPKPEYAREYLCSGVRLNIISKHEEGEITFLVNVKIGLPI